MQLDELKLDDYLMKVNILTFCHAAVDYLSIFSSKMERGPKVVVCRMRVRSTIQQHRHHVPISTGTCYMELKREKEGVKL